MPLLLRRLRVLWARYLAPAALEREPRFRDLLRRFSHQGLQVVGYVTAAAAAAYVLYRVLAGDAMVWNEDASMWRRGPGMPNSVQLWDKVLVALLGMMLVVLGRLRTGLRRSRLAAGVFFGVVTWFIVLRNFDPGNFNMAAAWLTLLMMIAVGAVPFRPWQMGLLGLVMTGEFWYFARFSPGMGGDVSQFAFLLLVSIVAAVVSAALYGSRYAQYRALRRIAYLKDYCAARSRTLERVLERERAMQDQLVQQEKLASLGQLTAGIAHEIKNPLNFVNNFASLSQELAAEVRDALRDDPARPSGEVAEELGEALDDLVLNVEKIAEHGWRADAIVKSMLAHSRATPGEREPTDLNALLDEYVGLAYHGMRARHHFDVEIERQYDEALEPVQVVPQELGRVFLNLLSNAFDALRAHAAGAGPGHTAHLRVVTRRTDTGAAIYISDNGPGMPREVAERVFEPFFTTKPSGEGTGLGLSLAYEIVTTGHGGTLDVRSREGEGTVFSITLPAEPPEEDGEPAGGVGLGEGERG